MENDRNDVIIKMAKLGVKVFNERVNQRRYRLEMAKQSLAEQERDLKQANDILKPMIEEDERIKLMQSDPWRR